MKVFIYITALTLCLYVMLCCASSYHEEDYSMKMRLVRSGCWDEPCRSDYYTYLTKYIEEKDDVSIIPQYSNQLELWGKAVFTQGLVQIEYVFKIDPSNSRGGVGGEISSYSRLTAREIITPKYFLLAPFSFKDKKDLDMTKTARKKLIELMDRAHKAASQKGTK